MKKVIGHQRLMQHIRNGRQKSRSMHAYTNSHSLTPRERHSALMLPLSQGTGRVGEVVD